MKKQRQKTDSELKAEILKKYGGIPEDGMEQYYKSTREKQTFYKENKKSTMTSKEKAEQLVGYFFLSVTNLKEQKKCANIVVREIISELHRIETNSVYWEEVKKEIDLIESKQL